MPSEAGRLLEQGAEAGGADLDLLGAAVDEERLLLHVGLEEAGRPGGAPLPAPRVLVADVAPVARPLAADLAPGHPSTLALPSLGPLLECAGGILPSPPVKGKVKGHGRPQAAKPFAAP